MKKRVYLAGGINGLSDAACNDWRIQAKGLLSNFETLDPMARDYRGKEDSNFTDIVEGDLADIRQSAALLVNGTRPSWGTAMEIVYAFGKVPVIAFVPAGTPVSPWLRYHAFVVSSLEEACEHLHAAVLS